MANQTVVTWRPWIDHSHPYDFRVTLPFKKGAAFQAVVTAFITSIVFPAIWVLVSFILHQLQASNPNQPFTLRLMQVFLRNHSTPIWVVWKSIRSLLDRNLGEQRQRLNRVTVLRTLGMGVIALAMIAFTITAAVESAKISTGIEDFVLLRSPQCGLWASKNVGQTGYDAFNAYQASERKRVLDAANYAKTCYRTSNTDPTCSRLPVREIEWTFNQNATCPFKSGTCFNGDSSAFEMTTALMDSNDHFGINAPPKERVQIQKRTTCAPMLTANYHDVVDGPLQYLKISRYFFGNLTSGDWISNTYNVSHNASIYTDQYTLGEEQFYMLPPNNATDDYDHAAPDFQRTDADPGFFFLEPQGAKFAGTCDDPMFAAHISFENDTLQGDIYTADYWATVIGCADQYRMCNGHANICTPFTGILGLPAAYKTLFTDANSNIPQISTAVVMFHATGLTKITNAVYGRGAQALRALDNYFEGTQYPLPNEQWKIEVSSWFDTVLASMQQDVYNFASGPDPTIAPLLNITKPMNPKTCDVKIHSSGLYKTFSGTGILLIFVLGGAFWVLSWFFDTIVGFLQCYTGKGAQRREQWNQDSSTALLHAVMHSPSAPRPDLPHDMPHDTSYKGYEMVGKNRESVFSEEIISPVTPNYDPPKAAMY